MVKETRQFERSNSFKKSMKRTPGGRLTTYAERRKSKPKSKCEICGVKIKISSKKNKALANVCNKCTTRISFLKAKVIEGMPVESAELKYKNYIKKL